MSPMQSVTLWIHQLKGGDAQAAQRLWEVYFLRMVSLARQKLAGAPQAAADEEDVALSAFKSFCLGAREGRFPQLLDRDNLWPLLMAITLNKSVDMIRSANRQKRGGTGRAANTASSTEPRSSDQPLREQSGPGTEQIDQAPSERGSSYTLSTLLSREPSPEFAVEMADTLDRLLARLDATGDADLRQVALLKMQGYATAEVAERLNCAKRTVERKLRLIATICESEM